MSKKCNKQNFLVVYHSSEEVLICRFKDERKLLDEYFDDGERNLDEYDRIVVEGVLCITSNLIFSADRTVD